jgi:hypothetical protein
MMGARLFIEFLSGPLDGHRVELTGPTDWTGAGSGPLVQTWETQLGRPQAQFVYEEAFWWLEPYEAPQPTRVRNHANMAVKGRLRLQNGDILESCHSWLLVEIVE